FTPFCAMVVNSVMPNAVPCVIVVCGASRQPAVVVTELSVANSASARESVPSPQWMRYAVVEPSAKLPHTPSALVFDGGKVALVWIESVPRPFCATSIERATEPKQADEVPGSPTMLVVPATRPLSSPYLSISQRRLPAAVP